MGRLCCPKCCEGYHEELDHCPRCGPLRPDCDAYEKRIAELEAKLAQREKDVMYQSNNYQVTHAKWEQSRAQLARVKAESLCVVKVGDELIEDADTWRCLDNLLGLYCRERDLILIEGDEANRVRLERWETEE